MTQHNITSFKDFLVEYEELNDAYNATSVQNEINKDKRIKGKEGKAIHALLKGRDWKKEADTIRAKNKPDKFLASRT